MESGRESSGYVIPQRLWMWLGKRRVISILFWIASISVAFYLISQTWGWFDVPFELPQERRRADGNAGHAQIDFGGQWVMGRMLVKGHGRELYHRQHQWEVVREGYPISDEPSLVSEESLVPGSARVRAKADEVLKHDADALMGWFMGTDPAEWKKVGGAVAAPLGSGVLSSPFVSAVAEFHAQRQITPDLVQTLSKPAIGGPLYPPPHAFLYAPIGAIDRPQTAYRVIQALAILMVFVAALGVRVLSRGKIWWSVAALVLLLYPGNRSGLDLGQNPTVTLAIAIWGWALASRGYNFAGGVVWGLFAFKPVWALAFLIVPILTRRWRFFAGMSIAGATFCIATLPFVGLQTWFEWLAVGKEAAALYNVNQNWINLSRDLQGIPRRILHDFSRAEAERDTPLTKGLAWALWGVVFATTAIVYTRYADRKRAIGVGAGFLFFGAWLSCYRFMYYDALVSAVAVAVLFAEPTRFLRTRTFNFSSPGPVPLDSGRKMTSLQAVPRSFGSQLIGYVNSFPLTILVLLLLVENSLSGMEIEGTLAFGYYAQIMTGPDGATSRRVPKLIGDSGYGYPWETFLILALWAWCGIRLVWGEERPAKLPHATS